MRRKPAPYFNLNLTAMEASVRFVCRVGPETVLAHNRELIARLFDGLPAGLVPASPLDPAAARPVRLLRRGDAGAHRGASPEALRRERLREPARRKDSCLATPVQLQSRHRAPHRRGGLVTPSIQERLRRAADHVARRGATGGPGIRPRVRAVRPHGQPALPFGTPRQEGRGALGRQAR